MSTNGYLVEVKQKTIVRVTSLLLTSHPYPWRLWGCRDL